MKVRMHKGKSLIDFPDQYICIDIETTGLECEYDDIIEISAAKVNNGSIIDQFSTLINPGHRIPAFITQLTGITNEMLIPAPPLKNIIPSFIEFIKDSILIGHNVNFDINFLYDACESFGYILDNNFVDNMRIARKLFPEEKHHRLIDVINMLDVSIERSHRADDDVLATLQCHEKMKQIVLSQGTISDFQDKFNKRRKYDSYKASAVSATVSEIDDSNPLFQKTCVFTGTLSFPRKEAWQLVANLGGIPADRITKKTNFLIIGDYDFIKSVKNGKTSKMRKAEEYKSSGLDISTLSESTFLDMVSEYIEIPQIKPKKINNIDDIVD